LARGTLGGGGNILAQSEPHRVVATTS